MEDVVVAGLGIALGSQPQCMDLVWFTTLLGGQEEERDNLLPLIFAAVSAAPETLISVSLYGLSLLKKFRSL